MAELTVRNLEDDIKTRLKQRAARRGHSMEEEVRRILRQAVEETEAPPVRLGSRIAARFAGLGLTEDLAELHGQPARPANLEP
jgi:plasmid stability protein